MGRSKHKPTDRDGVRFLPLPHVVLDATAFIGLSAPAVRLLLDIARQLSVSNNGKLTACMKYLAQRGWTSNDTITRARRELVDAGFLFETRKGMRPNRAAWFAVTWASLDWTPEMDVEAKSFPRGAYARNEQAKTQALHRLPV